MKKKNGDVNLPLVILSVFGAVVVIIFISFIYFSINGPDHSETYIEKILSGEIVNPVTQFKLDFFGESEEIELNDTDKVIKIESWDFKIF